MLEVEDYEILSLFELYLRRWCSEHEGEDTLFIKNIKGEIVFKATLIDKDDK